MKREATRPRSREAIETIQAIAEIVHGSLDFRTVAERATLAITEYTPFIGVSIFALDDSGETFDLVAYQGFPEKLAESGRRMPVRGSLMGLALERREVVTSAELVRETRGLVEMRDALVRDGFGRAICVPLIHADTPLGMMNLVVRGAREISDLERQILMSISETIAMALANARYVDRIEREVRQRKHSEERYALATSAAQVGVWDWNRETQELHVDPSLKALVGYADDEVSNDPDVWKGKVHPGDRDALKAALDDHLEGRAPELVCEFRMVHRDGSIRWMLCRGHAGRDNGGTALRIVGTNVDITERRRLEDERRELERQMLHAEKLKSLGVLAGGIAHDFNNLLTSILGNAGLAAARSEPDSAVRPFIVQIETAARRAAELTRQLLAYSGHGMYVVQPIDLVALAREMADLLEHSISKKAKLEYELTDGLPRVEGDAGQLRQVIMNLITNASEALHEEPGTIFVRTGVTEIDPRRPPESLLWKNLGDGEFVFFEVADTGCGMDPGVRSKIFDPFFTTKFTGRGLGLAAVQGIVRAHGGGIELDSSPGRGTRIRVLLPVTVGQEGPRVRERAVPDSALGGGTVLVVDDEAAVRTLVARVLEDAGFEVITAVDGRAGLDVFAKRQNEIRLVILDLTMPQLGGDELLGRIREIRPDARVVLSSGYSAADAAERFRSARPDAFLEKPYAPATLLDTVRRALDHSGST